MEKRGFSTNWFWLVIIGTLIFLAVSIISFYNYLLFHSLVEMFGIVVSIAIFIVTWNTSENLDSACFLIIGIAYLYIGSIDLLHLLAYKGMGVFTGGGSNLPTQLWIASRSLYGLTFFIAPFYIHRKISQITILIGYAAVTAFLIGAIFYWKIFPACFIENEGLTLFKKICEYVICLLMLVSVFMFYKERKNFDETVIRYLIASLCLNILVEISFTLYAHVDDVLNFLGHYFKVISCYFIYKALVETGLRRPYDVLFRNLKKSQQALGESDARYRSMMAATRDPVYICSSEFIITYVNEAMISRIGYDATGESCYKALNSLSHKCSFCYLDNIKNKGQVVEETFRQKDGRYFHVSHSPIYHPDGSISKLAVFRDVTELKKTETEYRQERDKARLYLDIVGNIVLVLKPDSTVSLINKKGCELLEGKEKDIVGKNWFDTFILETDREKSRSAFHKVISGELAPFEYFENRIVSRNNTEKIVFWHSALLRDDSGTIIGTLSSGEDVTETRRIQWERMWELSVNSALSELYIPLISPSISLEEICSKILEKAKKLTNSDHGYVSYIDPISRDNIRYTRTEMMKEECMVNKDDKVITFPIGNDGQYTGLLGHPLNTKKSFFTNDPEHHPSYVPAPSGYIPMVNFLSVPVLFNEQLVGQIALSDKPGDYNGRDLEAIGRLGQYYALAIHRWQTAEALKKAKNELELRVEERTQELSTTNLMLINEIEERKILEENLLKSESALKDLSAKLIQSYEEERRRIGEELHDGLAQTLSAIKVWADAAISHMDMDKLQEATQSINSVLSLSQASVEEVRNIIKNLRPAILDDLGLKAAISWLCQEFQKTNQKVLFEKQLDLDDDHLPENLKIVVFRILQEALNNISKHSGAKTVSVRVGQNLKKIELKIFDDGCGFDVKAAKDRSPLEKGIGLSSMEERARLSGGKFKLVSSPYRGTMIRATWNI